MKLSEALVLKAEWYLNTSNAEDTELSILLNDHEFVEDKSKPDMFWETYAHIKTNWKQWFGASNDVISYLCLLESELQKDEEYAAINIPFYPK
jgi:hypothetical protein